MGLSVTKLKSYLDDKVNHYNVKGFIPLDPISIPHSYTKKQDVEITAFWTSILAWGQRVTIINKAQELFHLMDNAPHDFILNHTERDRQRFEGFKHRTFNYTDTLYFLEFLQHHYKSSATLETAFLQDGKCYSLGDSLTHFRDYFFSLPDSPKRTQKHIASPARNSSCKRLCMFLRWMVRKDDCGVDFGIWNTITPDQLMMPLDVHVERVARSLGLIQRKQRDWKTVVELTIALSKLDAADPCKYDFALFGIGVDKDSALP